MKSKHFLNALGCWGSEAIYYHGGVVKPFTITSRMNCILSLASRKIN